MYQSNGPYHNDISYKNNNNNQHGSIALDLQIALFGAKTNTVAYNKKIKNGCVVSSNNNDGNNKENCRMWYDNSFA